MSRGKRYNDEQKLNLKKVFAAIAVVAVIILFIIGIKNLTKKKEQAANYFTEVAYYTMLQNDKWGVINSKGEIVIEPEYSLMIVIPDNKKEVFICNELSEDNSTVKTKVINANNSQLFTDYATVEVIDNVDSNNNIWFESNVLRVSKDGKYGLIDLDGKELAACTYDKIEVIKGIKDSLLIQKDGKVGLANNQGDVIVECEYESVEALTKNYTDGYIVKKDGKYGAISVNKEQLLECKYEEIKHVCGNDMYVVKEDGKWKITNKAGDKTLEIDYDDITYLSSDVIVAKTGDKYGIFGTDKSEKVKAEYQSIEFAYTDNYIAKKDEKYGVINSTGEVLVPFEYTSIIFNEKAGCLFCKKADDNNTYLIDRNHEVKVTGTDVEVLDGYIRAKVNDEYKFYNFKFEEKSNRDAYANHTLYAAKNDGKYGLVNRDGTLVIQYEYEDITEQNDYGYVAVKKDGKWGVIDQYGNTVVEPKYEISDISKVTFIGKWHSMEDVKTICFIEE